MHSKLNLRLENGTELDINEGHYVYFQQKGTKDKNTFIEWESLAPAQQKSLTGITTVVGKLAGTVWELLKGTHG